MQKLNAIDAIAPAFTRTHETLFHPFKLGRSWKLAASSYLAVAGSVFVPFPLAFAFVPLRSMNLNKESASVFAALVLAFTLVFLGVFYLCARMLLVNFEMVVTRAKFIAPMWRRYGDRVWPWIGLKVLLGTALTLALTPLAVHFVHGFIAVTASLPKTQPGHRPDPLIVQRTLGILIPFYGYLFSFLLVLKTGSTLVDDFALPFFILEECTVWMSLRYGLNMIAADPLQCVVYLALKLILSMMGFVMQYIANLVAAIPVFILFILVLIAGAAMIPRGGSPQTRVVGLAVIAIGYAVLIGWSFFTGVGMFGYLMTLLEAYGIYFLGGRYPRLGDYLEPPTPSSFPFTPPPSLPTEDDDSDGPSLPMDPALV